jgi:hypothetical protein
MTVIHNHTGVPHFWFEKSGPTGEPLDVLVVRATFDFACDGNAVTLAATQTPIAFSDEFAGPVERVPLCTVVTHDGDLLPYKPGTDVLVQGSAQAPGMKPHTEWQAGIQIGPVRKLLRLHGPRQWRKSAQGWHLGQAEPVDRVPLDYRRAFGGFVHVPAELMPNGQAGAIQHDSNPAGCGWLPDIAALEHLPKAARDYVNGWLESLTTLPAPQIVAADTPLTAPQQNAEAQGLGPLARWWAPRVTLQGTYDDTWRATRYPLLPADFDARYYQNAAPDGVAVPHLRGDEMATMVGLLPEYTRMQLPGWRIIAAVEHTSGECSVSFPLLDTVRFDLDRRQVTQVWRAHFERGNAVAEISLAATTQDIITDVPAPETQQAGT